MQQNKQIVHLRFKTALCYQEFCQKNTQSKVDNFILVPLLQTNPIPISGWKRVLNSTFPHN